MLTLQGKFNTAKVFTDNIDSETMSQIITLLNQEYAEGATIRIMPDTHAGAGCTIGTTMTIRDKVVPYMVGVDIGCGMETIVLRDSNVELEKLDKVIHSVIPAGFGVRKKSHENAGSIPLEKLYCFEHVNIERAMLSVGTLGGGNHFIELDRDDDGRLYLVVHSGSRNLGKQVADYYQNAAVTQRKGCGVQAQEPIASLKAKGRDKDIQKQLRKIPLSSAQKSLAYVDGEFFEKYLHDMAIVQQYADVNRKTIASEIVKEMRFKADDEFTTVHNYIDMDAMILRKGAISAKAGERVLIPINMRDGSLICTGKGNPDWNCSAPHGAGRIMSRSEARQRITLSEFKKTMEGIYSSTVDKSTIDEAPAAYKPMDEIVSNTGDTVDINKSIKPLYNFKASE